MLNRLQDVFKSFQRRKAQSSVSQGSKECEKDETERNFKSC